MKIRFILLFLYLAINYNVNAQEVIQQESISNIKRLSENTYEVTETVLVENNMTLDQARKIAFERCQHHAVGEHSGFWVESIQIARESEYNNSINSLFSKYGKISTKARILNRLITNEKFFVIDNEVFVLITAEIEVCEKRYNPKYNVNVETNRDVFEDGDDLQLVIEPSEDCYITLFLISPDDSLYVLFPLKKSINNKLKKDSKFKLPPSREKYTMQLDDDTKSQIDLLKIVATKNKYNFCDFGKATSYGNLRVNFQFMLDWFNSIPDNEIVEKDIPITVYNSNKNN